jgi:uncharacterized protein (TIGR02001 family)
VSCKQHKSDICYKGFNVYKIYIETLSLTNLIIKGIKMNKKIILSSFASLLFLSQAANAEIKIGTGSLTFNAAISSQYITRGVDQNKDSVTPSVGADFIIPAAGFNLYAGAWTSGSDLGDGITSERDYYLGVNKAFGITTLDLGYIIYDYANVRTKATNNAEYYAKLTIAPEKQPYTFGAAYYVDDTGGVKPTATSKNDRNYYELNATYDFGSVQSLISYGVFDKDTNTTTVSLSKELAGIGFTLSYISAERDGSLSNLYKDKEYVTLSAKKVF